LDSGRQRVLIARLAAAQVAAFEKLSAEGARTLPVVGKDLFEILHDESHYNSQPKEQ